MARSTSNILLPKALLLGSTALPNNASFVGDARPFLETGQEPGGEGGAIFLPPVSFLQNGSVNTAVRAMLARGSGIIVEKGDSTTVGAGAAQLDGEQTASVPLQLANARLYRPSAVMAAALTAAGKPAYDNGFVGDGSCQANGTTITSYHPRITFTNAQWTAAGGQNFAGGSYLDPNGSFGGLVYTIPGCDTFEVICFNVGGQLSFSMDGVAVLAADITAPGCTISGNNVTMPTSNSSLSRITIRAASVGTRVLRIDQGAGIALLHSVRGYNRTTPGIHFINHGSNGATSTAQAAVSGPNAWFNNDSLGFVAPDLTIIRLGLNDNNSGVTSAQFQANLAAIITKARLTGDALIVNSNAANPATFSSLAIQNEWRAAALATAVSMNVAYCDLREAFGEWATVASRTADNIVHPNRQFYADIGALQAAAILAM